MPADRHSDDFIADRAAAVLARRWGGPIRLRPVAEFAASPRKRFSRVLRCAVAGAGPDTVVVKKVREDNPSPYAPDDPVASEVTNGFFADWAALELFARIAHDPPILPAFHGGDRAAGLLVMEDLGAAGPGLDDALGGDDPERAAAALVVYMRELGRFHALSVGRAEQHRRLRARLGPAPAPHRLYDYPWDPARLYRTPDAEIADAEGRYRARFDALGVQPARGFDAEIAEITAKVIDFPGPFLALCQGDQNGVGGYIPRPGGARMYDFDCAGFRHALLEGMPHRLTWGGMTRVPAALLEPLDRAYQHTFARGCPAVADDARYSRAMVEAAACWHVFHVIDRLHGALERDPALPLDAEPLRGPSTLRQQILAWTEAFADLAEDKGHVPALGASARRLAVRLRQYWPPAVADLPEFPAFARWDGATL